VRTRRGAIEGIGHRRWLAYLPQQSALDRGFPVTLGELVALDRWRHFGAFRRAPSEISQRAATVEHNCQA
jgi:zinc/manganese transport system ATP-binding protein